MDETYDIIYRNVVAYPNQNILKFEEAEIEKNLDLNQENVKELEKRWGKANFIKLANRGRKIYDKIDLTPGESFLKGYRGGCLNIIFAEKERPAKLLLTKNFSEGYLDISRDKRITDDDWELSCFLNGNQQIYLDKEKEEVQLPNYVLESSNINEKTEEFIKNKIRANSGYFVGDTMENPGFSRKTALVSYPNNFWHIRYESLKGDKKQFRSGVFLDSDDNSLNTYFYNFREKTKNSYVPINIGKTFSDIVENVEINMDRDPEIEIYQNIDLKKVMDLESFIKSGLYKPSKGLKEALKRKNHNFGRDINTSYVYEF